MVERVFYNTQNGPPVKPSRPPVVGTPPQTHYQQPMPPVVQQWPAQGGMAPVQQVPMNYQKYPYAQYPPVVQQQVVVQQKRTTNHGAHLILTLLTGGLWAFVWLPLWAIRGQ